METTNRETAQQEESLRRFLNETNPDDPGAVQSAMIYRQKRRILRLLDEHGKNKYRQLGNPNALLNRFALRLTYARPSGQYHLYDPFWYYPTQESIRRTRYLTGIAEKHADVPFLETAQDFIDYFQTFSEEELKIICENLRFIELTEGCQASCRNVCVFIPAHEIKGHIPFEALRWLFDSNKKAFHGRKVALYYGSDLQYYESIDRNGNPVDGIDAIKLAREYGIKSYFSISWGGKTMYRAIIRALEEGIKVDRISRLIGGQNPKAINLLVKKIKEIYKYPLTAKQERELRDAFRAGSKNLSGASGKMNTVMGAAVKPDTQEIKISKAQVSCVHGAFLTRNGFVGSIIRPNSKAFPTGAQNWPIVTGDDFLVPNECHINDHEVDFMSIPVSVIQAPTFHRREEGKLIKDNLSMVDSPEEDIHLLIAKLEDIFERIYNETREEMPGETVDQILVRELRTLPNLLDRFNSRTDTSKLTPENIDKHERRVLSVTLEKILTKTREIVTNANKKFLSTGKSSMDTIDSIIIKQSIFSTNATYILNQILKHPYLAKVTDPNNISLIIDNILEECSNTQKVLTDLLNTPEYHACMVEKGIRRSTPGIIMQYLPLVLSSGLMQLDQVVERLEATEVKPEDISGLRTYDDTEIDIDGVECGSSANVIEIINAHGFKLYAHQRTYSAQDGAETSIDYYLTRAV